MQLATYSYELIVRQMIACGKYPATYKRLETPMSSALAAEVTAILDIPSEHCIISLCMLYVQYYEQHSNRTPFSHEHSGCGRSCKACTCLTWRKRRRIGREIWL